MRNSFLGGLCVVLGALVFWNQHLSKTYQAEIAAKDQTIQSLNRELGRVEKEEVKEKGLLANQKDRQIKLVNELSATLTQEKAVLAQLTETYRDEKNSPSAQLTIEQVSKEINLENETIRELDRQIQSNERQFSLAHHQGQSVTEEQKLVKRQQEAELNLKIQTLSMQLKAEQRDLQTAKRNRNDFAAQDRARALESQIETDKATLQLFQDQKRQDELEFSSDKVSAEAKIKRFQSALQQTINGLKSKRDEEKSKLSGLNRSLADLKSKQGSRTQVIQKVNERVSAQQRKVQELEEQLKNQRAVLNSL